MRFPTKLLRADPAAYIIEHVYAELRSQIYHTLLNFLKRLVQELFAGCSGVLCNLFEVGSGHPVGNIFDYQGPQLGMVIMARFVA